MDAVRIRVEKMVFAFHYPVIEELDTSEEYSFASGMQLQQYQWQPDGLNDVQIQEVMRQIGNPKGISAEGVSYAIEQYMASLELQAEIARDVYFGRLQEGLDKLGLLPEDVRDQIDKLVWDAFGGEMVVFELGDAQKILAQAIADSLQMRMGF